MDSLAFSPTVSNSPTIMITGEVCVAGWTRIHPGHGMPVMIPRSEAYYWSNRWQTDEQETLEAYDRGERVVFDSEDPSDIVRWLLSDD